MKALDIATKFFINFIAVVAIVLLFLADLDHIAIAFIGMLFILYTAEYSEKKLTNWY